MRRTRSAYSCHLIDTASPVVRSATRVGISFAVTGMIGMGTFFGSSAAGTMAFAGSLGNANIGGLLYAAVGFTSAIAALSVAFWPSGWPQASRWLAAAIFMVPAALALQLPGDLGPMIAALLVVGIGASLGGPTGYAINPARDLGPRIVHALLPIKNKGGSDWSYAWVPVLGPLLGGLIGGVGAAALF